MEIRNLKTFITIANLHSFTLAGIELGYSQSNVSLQIAQLESDVGVKLFDRMGKGVVLTQQGQELLPYAEQIVNTADIMQNVMKSEQELSGQVRVGMIESVFEVCFKEIAETFRRRFPRVTIDLSVESSSDLLSALKRNAIDAAVLIERPLPKNEWCCRCSRAADIGLVMRSGHPMSFAKSLKVSDIKDEKLLLMEESAPYNQQLYEMFSDYDLERNIALRMQSCDMAAKIVESSDLISFLPEYTVRAKVSEGKLAFIPLEGYVQDQHVQVIINKRKTVTPQISGFMDAAAAVITAAGEKQDCLPER